MVVHFNVSFYAFIDLIRSCTWTAISFIQLSNSKCYLPCTVARENTYFMIILYDVLVEDRYDSNSITFTEQFKHHLTYDESEGTDHYTVDKTLESFEDPVLFTMTKNLTSKLTSHPKYRIAREKVFGAANRESLGDMDWIGSCTASLFQPSSYFQGLLNKWALRFKEHIILGIQISSKHISRAQDGTIKQDVLDMLYAKIDAFMNSAVKPALFVSSDVKEYSVMLLNRYKGHCMTTKSQFQTQPGFTPKQAKYYHDLIDLFLLSQSNQLIVTHDSMFGALAVSMNPRYSRSIQSVFDHDKKVDYVCLCLLCKIR